MAKVDIKLEAPPHHGLQVAKMQSPSSRDDPPYSDAAER